MGMAGLRTAEMTPLRCSGGCPQRRLFSGAPEDTRLYTRLMDSQATRLPLQNCFGGLLFLI